MFCFVLARHIARPIDRLRSAARNIANQQLQTRVDGSVLERKDELADLGRDFDRMAERIEHLVTAQRHLLADVSHALRSPLARLNVALGLARQRNGQPTTEHLDRIETEAERLNTLIGQLLTMARVDSGVDLERPTRFDLGSVVEEVSTDADYEARHRQCAVAVPPARRVHRGGRARDAARRGRERRAQRRAPHRRADPRGRLAGCAGRRPTARARSSRSAITGRACRTTAVDSLFVPFSRVVADGLSNPERTGLGLAITRRTFEVHGGSATAANAPDGGFVVTLELPLPGRSELERARQRSACRRD